MYIDKAADYVGQAQTINGWVYNSRSSGKVAFVLVRDGSGIMQCVVAKSDVEESTFEAVRHLTQESSISITGVIHAEERAPGGHEMHVQKIEVHQAAVDYPITPKEHGVDFPDEQPAPVAPLEASVGDHAHTCYDRQEHP